jgi:hypothetical protein
MTLLQAYLSAIHNLHAQYNRPSLLALNLLICCCAPELSMSRHTAQFGIKWGEVIQLPNHQVSHANAASVTGDLVDQRLLVAGGRCYQHCSVIVSAKSIVTGNRQKETSCLEQPRCSNSSMPVSSCSILIPL